MPPSRLLAVLLAALALPPLTRGDETLCGTLADAFTADEAGLVREWVVQVPFDSVAWRLEHVTVSNGLVVAQSGDGGVAAIAAAPEGTPPVPPGTILWSQHVGRPGRSLTPAAVGDTVVAVADDSAILGIDRKTGHVVWQERTPLPIAMGPAAAGPWVYAPFSGNRLLRLAANPRVGAVVVEEPAAAGAKKKKRSKQPDRQSVETVEPRSLDAGGEFAHPPTRFGNGIAWCTTAGEVMLLVRTKFEWQRWEFDLGSPPAGGLLVRGETIVAVTEEGDVACLELTSFGLRTLWHAQLAERAGGGAFAAGPTLVVPMASGGAVGFDAATGARRWKSDAPRSLLAADATRLWCLDATGRLALFDPSTGARLGWFCIGSFTLPVTNGSTDRLVLASPKGTVVSLAPRPAAAVTGRDAPAPAPADPDATPPAADRRAGDPSE